MSEPDPIQRMADRIAQCRRLADSTTDELTRRILLQMADEGQQDMERLKTERGQSATIDCLPHNLEGRSS